jgi:RNA polymerase sigma-70 factor (sigma-E family)
VHGQDEDDFTEFVAGSARRLLRTAFLLTGDEQIAQDILQTALERAYRRWGRVRRSDQPEAYVRRMIVNAATDAWRAGRGRRMVGLSEACWPPGPDQAVDGLLTREALLASVRSLSAGQRAVLVLRYFDDLTEAESARVLGCSVGTVKSQHARAIARLRQLLPDRRLV